MSREQAGASTDQQPSDTADGQAAAMFRQVVESRRSVRKFDPAEPIPEAVMRECLELALLAPNSSNLQPWELLRVRTPELRARMVEICLGQNAARTAAELVVVVARTSTWRRNSRDLLAAMEASGQPVLPIVERYYRRLVPFSYGQGPLGLVSWPKRLLLAAIGLKRPIIRGPCGRAEMRQWAVKSCALAAQTLMLALRAHGFDSCPMEGFDDRRLRRLLRLPGDAVVVMVVAAGRGLPEGVYGPRLRLPSERFIRSL